MSNLFTFFLPSTQVIKPQIIQNNKISPDTNVQKTYTNIKQTNNFEELVPDFDVIVGQCFVSDKKTLASAILLRRKTSANKKSKSVFSRSTSSDQTPSSDSAC